tara:strand:+ start:2699 stop:7075 length:4377 start_codon:yes stop_codon:yes gene_type:complete
MADPQIPEQFEEAQETSVIIKDDPVLGPTLATGKPEGPIPEEAKKDVTVQREGVDFKEVLAGNVPTVGKFNVTPKLLDAAKSNPAIMRRLLAQHTISGQPTSKDEPIKPFMRDGEFTPTPALIQDPTALEKAERIAMSRESVDNILTEAGITDVNVRQVMIDKYRTGEFFDNLGTRLAEAGQFVVTAVPLASVLSVHAHGALRDSIRKGTDWSSEWASRQRDIQGAFDYTYKTIDRLVPNPTMKMAFNSFIQDGLRTRLENGQITPEEFNKSFYVTDAEGNITDVEKEFLTDDTARTLLDYSFQELPTQEKFGVIFVETFLGMAGPGQVKGAFAMRKYKRLLKEYKGTDVGKAIAGKTDPFEVVNIMESMGVKTKINRNALSIGVAQQRADAAQDILVSQIDEAGIKLDALRIQGVPKRSVQYKVAKGEYEDLINRMLRAKYTAKVIPYVKAAGTDALVISAGQLTAREYLPQFFEVTPETAEFIGAIGMVAGGAHIGKAIGGGLINATTTPRGGIQRVASRTMDFLAAGVTLGGTTLTGIRFTDNTIKNFEMATGRKLSSDELRGIKASVQMVNSLNPRDRDKVVNALDEYVDLRDRIVNEFPEADREEAAELFSMSFSNASGLNFLSAIRTVKANYIDIRDLKGMEIESVVRSMEASFKQVEITESALKNLENLIERSSVQDPEAVTNFINNNRKALRAIKEDNMDFLEAQQGQLDDIRKQVLADPTIELPEGFITELASADVRLNRMLGNVVDERASLGELMTDLYTGLSTRLTVMKSRRPQGRAYYQELGRTMEDVMDAHLEMLWNKGESAYADVKRLAQERPNVDMGNVVEEMMNKAGETAYHRFFSPEGLFFAGRLGRQNRMVFNDMARRALGDVEKIRDSLVAGGVSQELVDSLDDFGIAMEFKRINPGFEPFSELNAYEVDVMRRSFRDYAFRIRDKNPGLTDEYKQYADVMDDAIRSDGEMYTALEAARSTYRSEVGDRLRTGLLYKLDKSRTGGKIVTVTSDDLFQYAYRNVNPLNMFKGISNNMTKALQGNYDAGVEITAGVGEIVTSFADTVDGKRVFDLTTKEGRMKFDTIQRAISEKVYADWASRELKVFEKVAGPSAAAKGGYKFDVLEGADTVNSLSMVPVRMADGTTTEVPLINLRNIYNDAKGLEDFVAGSEYARKKYTDLISDYNNVDSKLRRNISNTIKKQDDDFAELMPFLGQRSPRSFYEDYIINGSPEMLDDMRDLFVAAQVKAGKKAEEAVQIFDAGVGRLVAKGFKERGGLQPVPTATLQASQRDRLVARQFTVPEQMLADVDEHREKLVAVLGEDHVDYLTDIATFLTRAKSESVPIEGATRGYSLNEALSRLYNISRGMVSPLYVTSEYMVRIASRANIELFELAAQNKDAAEIISKMYKTPELITKQDFGTFQAYLSEFVFTEMARNEMLAPELNEMFLLPEGETDEEDE